MLLKKQTVWLLTMLSLVVVLSAYYLTSPDQKGSDVAISQEEKDKAKDTAATKSKDDTAKGSEKEGPKVAITSSDDEFEALRISIQDQRSKISEDLQTKMGDTSLSTEEINKAVEASNKIDETGTKEQMLEYEIMQLNYPAALVRIDGNKVEVTVKTDEVLTGIETAEIMGIVNDEIEDAEDVAVQFKLDEGK